MTPSARAAAAIGLLDRILAGEPAERALTSWGRGARYAGAQDRAAVRDLVFDALRCRRSHGVLGGGSDGRALVLGGLRARGLEPSAVFAGGPHGPPPLTPAEAAPPPAPTGLDALDCPDWLEPELRRTLGPDFAAVLGALRLRAPVHLRVNLRATTRDAAAAELAAEGISTRPHPLADTALEVTDGARRVARSAAYRAGRVELQDAASQAVAAALPVPAGGRVLDLCAGGGGKTLALAARVDARFTAHDADPRRMADLPARAARAGVGVRLTDRPEDGAPHDLVLCDVPCSGSGAWRRAPEAKWRLTAERLAELRRVQAAILDRAAGLVAPGGTLAYVTCSLLEAENGDQVAAFLARHRGWRVAATQRLTPLDGGDGFYSAHLTR